MKEIRFKGKEERLPEVEAILKKKRLDRKTIYLILKYFEMNPDCRKVIE